MDIRVLVGADARAFQHLRLEGLRDCPTAFASNYEDEHGIDIESVAARLEPTPGRAIYGAFDRGSLVGIVGVLRESRRNLRHKAMIWGMYVTPAFRGKGIGRDLLKHALDCAVKMQGLRQVNLCVNPASPSAVAMYRAAGFEPFGVERAFLIVDDAAQDLIHMVRVLAAPHNESARTERLDPMTAARAIVTERFKDATVTFLGGSVMRGEATATSDLDLVVVYERLEAAYRESFVHEGWPVEAFVHDPETLRYFFLKVDTAAGIPSLPDMVASGVPLPRANDLSKSLQALARATISTGPPLWDEAQVAASRYAITSLVDDIRSPRSRAELTATATALYSALGEHFLRAQGSWSAAGKGIPRRLESVAPAFARCFSDAFTQLFANGQSEAAIRLCEDVLMPYGGWSFAGHKVVAPSDWRLSMDVPAHDNTSERPQDG